MIEIPLTNAPEQKFSLRIYEKSYDFVVLWNTRGSFWTISASYQGSAIIVGVPLLSGTDIFKQHNFPIENVFVVNIENGDNDPSYEGLGTSSRLFILTDEELADASTV